MPEVIGGCVLGVLGVVLGIVAIWSWRGRTYAARWWTRTPRGQVGLLMLFPTALLACITGFLIFLNASTVWLWAVPAVLTAAVGVWSFIVTTIGIFWWPAQRLWGPRWYVRLTPTERDQLIMNLGTDQFDR